MSRIVGIDLGTSTTCISSVEDGQPIVVHGVRNKVIPSYIYVMEDGRILIGENAKAQVIADPYNTIWATKRLIGRAFKDQSVQDCLERFAYQISGSDKGGVLVHGRERPFTPINVATLILKSVGRQASKFLGQPVEKAVITVPASFNDLQRKATKMAGERAGLEVVRLVNEPTAAALAWGYTDDSERTIAVYDLGGGTFDVSILVTGNGVYEVLATRGNSWLGGEDFDNRIVDYVTDRFKKQHKINIYNDKMAHQRIKTAAENAKIELSSNDSTRIYIESICPDLNYYADVDYTISRDQFDKLAEDLVDKTIETFRKTIEDAELEMDDLDNIILVGGMTRIPLVREKLEEFLGRPPDFSIDPDEAVAKGAAIHAAALAGQEVLLPAPAAVKPKPKQDEVLEVGTENTEDAASTPGETQQSATIELPAEAEAISIPAAPIPLGQSTDQEPDPFSRQVAKAPLLIDVLSQSVGISDVAGLFVPLIEHNTKLPTKVSKMVTTCVDRQAAIRISVYQGEERYVKDKVTLGEFVLKGIELASRGIPQIEVIFNIDQSGIFTVTACDLKTNAVKEIRVEGTFV